MKCYVYAIPEAAVSMDDTIAKYNAVLCTVIYRYRQISGAGIPFLVIVNEL